MLKEVMANGVTVYCGDCVEALADYGSVDHIIGDPPYEAHMHNAKFGGRGKKAYGAQRRIRIDGHANPPPIDFSSIDGLRERATAPMVEYCNGWLILFCTPEGIAPWRDAIEAAGARYKRACFWIKPDATPQLNGQGPAMGVEAFVTAWCGRGYSRWNGGGRRNVFTHLTNQPDRHGEHPTEKPIPLMAEIITLFTNTGETVGDPFMGSGTTGLAAIRTGRRFVGVEMDRKYYDLARYRIGAVLKQPDMLIPIPAPLRQVDLGFPRARRPRPAAHNG